MDSTATHVAAGPGTEKLEGGFARKASGLVRDFSQLDAWIYNVIALNLVINVAFLYVAVTTTYPHASLPLAILICGAFCVIEAVVYAFFVAAMPRSGGDYVFQSRVLGGGAATFFAFTAVALTQIVFMALSSYLGATLVLSPFMLLLGTHYHWSWMVSFGNSVVKPTGIFITCVVIIAWSAWINIKGLRTYALVQRYVFWLGLACLAIVMVMFLATSHSAFVNNLNAFMKTNYHVPNAYQATIKAGGTTSTSFSFGDTLLATVLLSLVLAFPMWGVAQAGEIKRANSLRGNIVAIAGAEVFAALGIAAIAAILISKVGHTFLYASGHLYFTSGKSPLPVPPFFGFFAGIAQNSAFFIWVSFIMFICWFFMLCPNAPMAGARVAMAMSFDRVLPAWFGKVNSRSHTPINAIAAMCILAVAASALYAYSTSFQQLTLAMILPSLTGFGATMIAAILFPVRRKAMFNATVAARHKIAGIPVMVVCAVVFLAFVVFIDYQCLFSDAVGVNGTKGLVFVAILYGVAAATYLISKIYRKRREGLDLSVVYRELPVE
jgi:APA family basic amino acid/polyamine antiporter